MPTKTTLAWKGGMSFEADVNGFRLLLDADEKFGGRNLGPRPKPLLLAAMSGCAAMDVVSILDKMKVRDYTLNMEMEADLTDTDPKVYHTIRMKYLLQGANLPLDKVEKAVTYSRDKYCGVYAMLSQAAKIIISININGEEVWHD